MSGNYRRFTLAIATAAMAAAVACSGGNTPSMVSPSTTTQADIPANPSPHLGAPDFEFIELCKTYVGGIGPSVKFDVDIDVDNNGSIDVKFQVTLAPGECKDIWVAGGVQFNRATITETVPTGFTASSQLTVLNGITNTTTTFPVVPGNVSTGAIARGAGGAGSLVVFTNTALPPPPPPPGLQGCTPGYWKQEQHFDSWTAPFTPNTLFNTVFDNAFPGKTLLQVLENGGGGLDALGRHTVAALLNSASNGVNYGLTPAQVIAAFNAVFPGGNYEGQKNIFAALNERNCPLN
jgi:hypothetical protein